MGKAARKVDPLENIAELIDWLTDRATDETGASDALRKKLAEAKEQAKRDLDTHRSARGS